MREIKLVSPDARPEDIQGEIGVSARFDDENLQRAIAERLGTAGAATGAAHDDARNQKAEARIESIAGKAGTYQTLDRSLLEATPDAWNDFSPISDEKKILMAESIYHNGMLQPIVVRAMDAAGNRYEILAGNTRNEIYGILYRLTQEEKYRFIDARVYGYGELSDDQAREIVSDTNYIQRAALSAHDRAFAVHTKLEMLRKRKANAVLSKVAEELEIAQTSVFYWDKVSHLIPEIQRLYDDGSIKLNAAARIGGWPEAIQTKLYEQRDLLTNDIVMKIPARTKPESVMDKFFQLVEQLSAPERVAEGTYHVQDTEQGYAISVRSKKQEGVRPLVLMLPAEQFQKLAKKYRAYVLTEE